MHPIERLRYVARAGDVPVEVLVRETAGALSSFANDPIELLTACRQLLRRRPGSAHLVWLTARMITGPDPVVEARDAVESVRNDRTAVELAAAIPDDSTVLVIGSPGTVSRALMKRPDVKVRVVDAAGEGFALQRELQNADHSCVDIPDWGIGAAASTSDLVLLEAEAAGPAWARARSGSRAAAAVAVDAGVAAWLVAGVGAFLPVRMWDSMIDNMPDREEWLADFELIPMGLIGRVCGRSGLVSPAEAALSTNCPIAPELFR